MNILFIAPIYFGYEKAITADLKLRYNNVIFRSEVPFNSAVRFYALRRLLPKVAGKAQDRYTKQLLEVIKKENIDRIFVLRGYGIKEKFFSEVHSQYPQIEIINYQWDSIQNNPNGLMIAKYAHKNYSFDLKDVENYPQFTHLPLFYTWEFLGEEVKKSDSFKKDIDLLFVGGYHSKRHLIVEKAHQDCEKRGKKVVSHVYLPMGSYLRDRFTSKEISKQDVSFRKIPRQKYYNLLSRSRVVLDIQSETQTGATIRTFETLSLGRKLVSTNEMLKRENFFMPDNIMIWNPEQELDIDKLLATPFNHEKDEFILTVGQWLNRMGM